MAFELRARGCTELSPGQRRKRTEIQKAGAEEAAAGSKLGCQGRKWLRYREHTGYMEDMCALLQAIGVFDLVRKWHSWISLRRQGVGLDGDGRLLLFGVWIHHDTLKTPCF